MLTDISLKDFIKDVMATGGREANPKQMLSEIPRLSLRRTES